MTQRRHDIGHYKDGHMSVAFCKVCSAEGDKLLEDCQGAPLMFCFQDMTKEEFDIKFGKPVD